jgi:flagellar hook-basal body complex protein FliE
MTDLSQVSSLGGLPVPPPTGAAIFNPSLKGASPSSVQPSDGPSFADALADKGREMVDSVKKAEAASIAGMKGEANTYDVVSSVMHAEQQLRMATAVRDKIIQSFLEISRMQI